MPPLKNSNTSDTYHIVAALRDPIDLWLAASAPPSLYMRIAIVYRYWWRTGSHIDHTGINFESFSSSQTPNFCPGGATILLLLYYSLLVQWYYLMKYIILYDILRSIYIYHWYWFKIQVDRQAPKLQLHTHDMIYEIIYRSLILIPIPIRDSSKPKTPQPQLRPNPNPVHNTVTVTYIDVR